MAWGLRSNWRFFHQRKKTIFFIDLKNEYEESRVYVNHKFLLDSVPRNCAQVCPLTLLTALLAGVYPAESALIPVFTRA